MPVGGKNPLPEGSKWEETTDLLPHAAKHKTEDMGIEHVTMFANKVAVINFYFLIITTVQSYAPKWQP